LSRRRKPIPRIVGRKPKRKRGIIDMPDGEKLWFFEGFCNKCMSNTVHVYSSKGMKFVCTGCGKEISNRTLIQTLQGKLTSLIK
jgi:ribosomal protein S27E